MTGQDVEDDPGGMDVVRQGFGTGCLDGLQPVGEHGAEDLDHLSVATGLAFQLALNTPYRDWQFPVLERCAVAQSTGFARQNRDVMERVVDRPVAPEDPKRSMYGRAGPELMRSRMLPYNHTLL